MAPPTPLRRRPGAVPAAALATLAVLTVLGVLAFGHPAPGGLRDDGPRVAVTPPTSAKPLWPGLATAPPPATSAIGSSTQAPPPQPVPDLTAPGHDLTAVDLHTLLAKDPAVSTEERRALDSCTGCEVRAPEFRDLTGDGLPELIAAVATPGQVALHVYTLTGDRVLPILRVQIKPDFGAATLDSDLWLYEPTTVTTRTTSHYQWDGTRLALVEKRVDGIGLLPPTDPGTDPPTGTGAVGAVPGPVRPSAEARPGAGAAVPTARPGRPQPQPAQPSQRYQPTPQYQSSPQYQQSSQYQSSQPSAPAVVPEAKR
ncbi:hypothetical protein ACIGXI_20485 [Kitasatospora aureofaciens]|uniref:hypothetical protein n=1 Tax=Kitasatospora aureofaciens TaxID=1894 RepID=UPI0037C907E5